MEYDKDDYYAIQRQEYEAYRALEMGSSVSLSILEKNLRNSGMSRQQIQSVIQGVVDRGHKKSPHKEG